MARSQWFWNLFAKRYARQPIADEAGYQRKLALTQSRFTPDMELLEFGCGTGSTALVHAPNVRHITAIDYSAEMIGIARARAEAAQVGNVTFAVSSIEDLDAADRQFDMVLGLNVLHLLEDRNAGISKAFSLLRPGGFFVSSTACIADMGGIIRWLLPVGTALRVLPLVKVFSAADLVTSMTKAGFEIEENWHPATDKALFLIARRPSA